MFLVKGVLKICSKFIGEHPCRSVISIKLLCECCNSWLIVLGTVLKFSILNNFRGPGYASGRTGLLFKSCSVKFRTSRPEVFSKKRCSDKFRKIHKKTPVPESF